VQFINDVVTEPLTGPALISPGEERIDDLGRAVNTLRLEPGGGVRALHFTVKPVEVKGSWFYALQDARMIPALISFEWSYSLNG
jgi:hypothetical protein